MTCLFYCFYFSMFCFLQKVACKKKVDSKEPTNAKKKVFSKEPTTAKKKGHLKGADKCH